MLYFHTDGSFMQSPQTATALASPLWFMFTSAMSTNMVPQPGHMSSLTQLKNLKEGNCFLLYLS